jgi:CRISPR-associated protein Csb2
VLTLEMELLTGTYRASLPDGSGAEWPPHPERVFSAFVQAWGDGGMDDAERKALEWLEALEPPEIEASGAYDRDAPTVFVPPNDVRGERLDVLPDRRKRQARAFRVCVPDVPLVRLCWPVDPPAPHRAALEALASRVASIGHSTSLVRCALHDEEPTSARWRPDPASRLALRVPYAGRLEDLVRWYSDDGGSKAVERPRSRRSVGYREPSVRGPRGPVARSVFGGARDWFVFEEVAGARPDLLAFGHVARRVRDTLMKVGPQPTPGIISGHAPDGARSETPHLAIVPLADVGWEHSSGELLGFAVVLPRTHAPSERNSMIEALAAFAHGTDVSRADLQLSRDHLWTLEHARHPSRTSLRPARWCERARLWASATPVVLDRFPHDGAIDEARCVAAACRNIGLPEPVMVELHKHPAIAGAPSAYPRRGRRGPDWLLPAGSKFSDRPRRHVVLRFDEDVEGPVILGAGRYHGFGLCLPIAEEHAR